MRSIAPVVLVLCVFAAGCGDDEMATVSVDSTTTTGGDGDGDSGPASFSMDVQPILTARCALGTGCHGAGASRINLNDGVARANLVGQTSSCNSILFVDSGSSATSFIINKLEGTQPSDPGCGSRMPLSGGFLDPAQIARIAQWIDEGAGDN